MSTDSRTKTVSAVFDGLAITPWPGWWRLHGETHGDRPLATVSLPGSISNGESVTVAPPPL